MKSPNIVYFIKPVGLYGPIKIGCATVPQDRLLSLSAWSPWPLEILVTIPGSYRLEQDIHECMARSYSHREWFHATAEVLALVEKLRAGVPIEQAIDLTCRHTAAWRAQFRNPRTNQSRLHMSYVHRLRWAIIRIEKATGKRFLTPADVDAALGKVKRQREPPPADIERLERFLSDPAAYAVEYIPPPLTVWKKVPYVPPAPASTNTAEKVDAA